jgi:desulfoferrodoxin (superoxide reductase-like protein)
MPVKFYECRDCGNIITYQREVRPSVHCCGRAMQEMEPNTADASMEKHKPVLDYKGKTVMVRVGDVVQVRRQPVIFSFKVLALSQNRLGAKLVPEYMQQVTTPDQLELWEMLKLDKANNRAKGLGRPTKKDRRDLDDFFDETPYFIDEDDFDFENFE